MKLFRVSVLLLTFLFILGAGSAALAATEVWTADPNTGSKICIMFMSDGMAVVSASWSGPIVDGKAEGQGILNLVYKEKDGKEIKAQADAEMKAGKLDGKVTIKYSDGDAYDGFYKAGFREGKGVFKYADGRVYEGDWKAGAPDGYGVGKDSSGKVIHEGAWKDGQPVAVAKPLKTDKVLGIPWGASEEQARSIMKQRPNTNAYSFMNGKDAYTQWKGFSGPFADFNDAEIWIHFYQDKMWQVQISWPLKDDQAMDRFNAVKQGLTERYGAPSQEKGKYLDSLAVWDLGGGYFVNVQIRQNTIKYIAGTDPALTHPFRVFITYHNQAVADLIDKTAKPGGANKDY